VLGASAAVLALVPVAIAGALLGVEGGLITALLAAIATAVLWDTTRHEVGEPVLSVGGNGLGLFAMMGIGAGFGAMRALRGRLDVGSRRASALAEAALTLELGAGPDTLAVLTRAALEVVPADGALMYSAIPGGGLEIVAAYGAPRVAIGQRETNGPLQSAYASAQPRLLTATETAAITRDARHARSGIVAPIGALGDPAVGVLLVFASRPDSLKEVHVEALRTYAAFVAIALSNPLESRKVANRNLLSV
jgi:GAF domain-containing protein